VKLARLVQCIVLSASAFIAVAASAQQVKLLPKYAIRGEEITDQVAIKQERKGFEASYQQFRVAASEYQAAVKEFIGREINGRKMALNDQYRGQIDALDKAQYDLRRNAIERMEEFVFRHRDHDTYTPDTLFRLAELYYEDTKASYGRGQDQFNRDLELYNRGKLLDPPKDPDQDFSRSIAIYKYLHWLPDGAKMDALSGKLEGVMLERRWPNYKYADAAMYLQGFCESEQGETDKSIATFSAIEAHYPKSAYVPEAWLRVGEMWFEQNEFENAADAYKHAADAALRSNDDANYMLALYKLGWSHFQLYKYPDAVRYFQKLIEYEVQNEKTLSVKAKQLNLRKEAVEYLAKSLAEPSWDDDNCDDFGSEDAKSGCIQLDPALRPRLYVSSIIEPKFDDEFKSPQWLEVATKGSEVRGRLEANYNARQDVRRDLTTGDKPYLFDILQMYGNTLYEQSEDEYYRQAVLVFAYAIDRWPMSREAQGMQRKVIRSIDILAAAAEGCREQLKKHQDGTKPLKPDVLNAALICLKMSLSDQSRQTLERQKYLTLFGKDSAWFEKWGGDKDLAQQVEDTTTKYRGEFAMLMLREAQALKQAGKMDEAMEKYAAAAREFESILKADPKSAKAYEIAWTLADSLYFGGIRCKGMPNEKTPDDPTPLTWPAPIVPAVKKGCDSMQRSVEYYVMVRDWKGPRPLAEGSTPEAPKYVDHREEAGMSAMGAAKLILQARASYPKEDPDALSALQLADIRPTKASDDAEDEACKKVIEESTTNQKSCHVKPLPMDGMVTEWMQLVDNYTETNTSELFKDDLDRIPKLALQLAELLYKNRQFDANKELATDKLKPEFWSARDRFWWILKRFPKSPIASEAFKDLLTTYQIEHDFDKLQELADWGEAHEIGDKKEFEIIRKQVKELSLGAIAKAADGMLDKADKAVASAESAPDPEAAGQILASARKTYDNAGELYYDLRKQVTDTSRQKASLMNAARAWYRGEQWDKCVSVLKEAEDKIRNASLDDIPQKDHEAEKKKNIERLEEIVQMRADLNFKFFKIREAIADYRLLYDNAIKSTDKTAATKAAKFLDNAAKLAFFNSDWDLAVELDKQIISRYEKDSDPEAKKRVVGSAWRIQENYQKRGDVNGQITALEAFIARFANDTQNSAKVFKAYGMIADIYESRGDKKNAEKLYKRILEAFQKGGYELNGKAESSAAAQSQFMLMKPRYEAFMAFKLSLNPKLPASKQMPDIVKQIKGQMDTVLGPEKEIVGPDGKKSTQRGGGMYDEYDKDVTKYNSQNWSYAAYLYRAKMLQFLARTIYTAPQPENLTPEQQEELDGILENFGKQIENRAIKSLEIALKDAESKGAVNQWVTELRKAINSYKPKEYPLLKDEKRMVMDPTGTLPEPDKELR
jgi:tetratricopeptide (TPR) repeat protein